MAYGDLFCRPAAYLWVNASVSVPVQSYRSERSQALCLVNPWERPHSVLLSENRNTDSIGKTTRAENEQRSMNPTYQTDSRQKCSDEEPRKAESGQRNTGRQMKQTDETNELNEMKVIRKEWNEIKWTAKGRERGVLRKWGHRDRWAWGAWGW